MATKNKQQVKQSISNIQSRLQTMPKGSPQYASAQSRLANHQSLLKAAPTTGGRAPAVAPIQRPQLPAQAAPQAQPMQRPLPVQSPQMPMQQAQRPMPLQAQGMPQGQPMQPKVPLKQPQQFPPSNPSMPQNTGIVPQGLNPQVTEQVFSQLQGGLQQKQPQPGGFGGIAPGQLQGQVEQPLNQPMGGGIAAPIGGQTQPLQGGVVKPGGIAQSSMQYNTLTGRR